MSEHAGKPEIRFAGFTETWEQRKLGDVADIVGGGTPSTNNPSYWNGDIDWYAPAEIGEQIFLTGSQKKITVTGLQKSSATILPVGSVLFTSRAGIGNTAILAKQGATNQGFQSIVPDSKIVDSYFIFSRTHELKKYAEIVGAGSTFTEVSGKQMARMPILMPKIDEQVRIGTFFRHLDHLVTLHQRKRGRLGNIKKAMLEKMFPKNGSDAPEIRFAGFTEAWEQRKLGELAEFLPNNTFSRAELSENGRIQNIHYGDVLIKFGEVLDVANEQLPFVAKTKKINKIRELKLENGDIVFADAAEDKTVGKCTELFNIIDKIVISGLHTIPCRPQIAFATAYLGYFFNSPCYRTQLLPLMQGIKVLSLSKTALLQTDIFYPKDQSEQARIGTFFRHLDRLITLHQRKVALLQNIKKACLEKMFV